MSNPAIGLAGLRFCSVIYFGLPNVLLNECTVPLNLIIYCHTLQPRQKKTATLQPIPARKLQALHNAVFYIFTSNQNRDGPTHSNHFSAY